MNNVISIEYTPLGFPKRNKIPNDSSSVPFWSPLLEQKADYSGSVFGYNVKYTDIPVDWLR